MKVRLLDYTGFGHDNPADHAANVLLFTKNTRLNMTPATMAAIVNWSEEKKREELAYMANTLPSSWEFVHYTVMITECTRAFTHQLVRTRSASYAQQTMRTVDMDGFTAEIPREMPEDCIQLYQECMEHIRQRYKDLRMLGARAEDARGVLPTNIHTNICMSLNLRTVAELARKRTSHRVQGEYREFVEQLRLEVMGVHPFTEMFLQRTEDDLYAQLEEEILSTDTGADVAKKDRMVKLLYKLRSGE